MMRSLFSAASGMNAQTLNMDVISNNLANINTVGFKKSRTEFQDLIYQTLREPGARSSITTEIPTGIQVGLGVKPVAVNRVFSQGNFKHTGGALDMVIEGDGFFQVSMPDGAIAFTRDGTFSKDSTGRVVTNDGYPLEPALTIPADAISITIGNDGTISILRPGENEATELGTIQLVKFVNPAGLKSLGKNLFMNTASSGDPIQGTPGLEGLGTIAQGYQEMSNVDIVEELVGMIIAQRAYETCSKAIQAADGILRNALTIGRG
ncbi:MAG: flagellar basal-body rod protein FlgG [Candidatus Aminicenantes bacterium]|nr:flagellar basal-body rod protein FlgG [Candidatus Aminicenantes bacterium]